MLCYDPQFVSEEDSSKGRDPIPERGYRQTENMRNQSQTCAKQRCADKHADRQFRLSPFGR